MLVSGWLVAGYFCNDSIRGKYYKTVNQQLVSSNQQLVCYTSPILLADIILGLIALLLVALIVTMVMHIMQGVPYVPTPHWVAREMVRLARLKPGERVIDLGAGDGRVLSAAMEAQPKITAIGCELVPTVWLLGVIRRFLTGGKYVYRLGDARKEDLREADVLLLYLMSNFLEELLPKFKRELPDGCRIISHTFKIKGREPEETVVVKKGWRTVKIHVYKWRAK